MAALQPDVSQLTKRELQIAELVSFGYSIAKISETLGINIKTAAAHCDNIRKKLKCADSRETDRTAGQELERVKMAASPSHLAAPASLALHAALYVVIGWMSFSTAYLQPNAATIWLPSGFAIGLLLAKGRASGRVSLSDPSSLTA